MPQMYDKDVCIWQIFAIIVQGVHSNGQSLVNLYVASWLFISIKGFSVQNWSSSNLSWEVCCLVCGKVKHQRVLWLTLLASVLLPINFVSKLAVLFTGAI